MEGEETESTMHQNCVHTLTVLNHKAEFTAEKQQTTPWLETEILVNTNSQFAGCPSETWQQQVEKESS